MTRSDIQEQAAQFIYDNDAVLLEKATGTGKTKAVLDTTGEDNHVLIVIKQLVHRKNWEDEMDKWGVNREKFIFTTYNSLHKLSGSEFDKVIFDEAHRVSEITVDAVKEIKYKKIVFLTATLPYLKKILISKITKFKTFKFDLNQAITEGVLPEPVIYIYDRVLDNTERRCIYTKKTKNDTAEIVIEYPRRMSFLTRKGITVHVQCTEKEYYQQLTDDMEYWRNRYLAAEISLDPKDQKNAEFYKSRWLQLGNQRKRWFNSLKTELAKQLIEQLDGKRMIIFTTSIDQCDVLARLKGYTPVHSKRKDNQEVIDAFNNYETDRLYNCTIMTEGMNLVGIEAGVIIGIDGQLLSTWQRLGRLTRAEKPEIHIIRTPGTQDEKYLERFLKEYQHAVHYK